MTVNSEIVLTYLRRHYGEEVSKQQIVEDTGVPMAAVTRATIHLRDRGFATERSEDAVRTAPSGMETPYTIRYFKLTEDGNDDNFLTADRHAYTTPDEEQIVEIPGVSLAKGENTKPGFKLALDFAGNPAGSVVTIKDIIIQEAE